MAQNKKSEFDQQTQALSKFAKALSHPARVLILQTIAQKKECICGEIVDVLPLAQSTVSQHLKELKEIGLIQGEVEGVKSCYCVNWEKVSEFENSFLQFMKALKKNKKKSNVNCCD